MIDWTTLDGLDSASIEPEKKPRKKKTICVIDAETDPFLYGRAPKPFAWGCRFGDIYIDFWGKNCTRQLITFLKLIKDPMIIYAHNGGKFDFFFLLRHIENPMRIIHGRIAKARLGKHELRDSWLINPQALSAYKKDEIDYSLFEEDKREAHKGAILNYLQGDCQYLYELCTSFVDRFGPILTAPSAAMKELKKIHPQKNGGKSHDTRFRPFYFGGRVECFESGVINERVKVYDVNSMYPHAMREFDHPAGQQYIFKSAPTLTNGWISGYPGWLYFARVLGTNRGALPVRSEDNNGGLSFTREKGEFLVCSHELRAALELGVFTCDKVLETWIPTRKQRFAGFVDKYFAEKIAAKKSGDKISEIWAKLMLNSAYGKFGQNPEDFHDYYLERLGIDKTPSFTDWVLYEDVANFRIWRKRKRKKDRSIDDGEAGPQGKAGYFDVAIAASITSAARSVLMRAIVSADKPLYCDTDSLICRSLGAGVPMDDRALGAWKYEGTGNRLALGGKKLYALFEGREPVKWASKGVHVEPHEIEAIAQGASIVWANDAPNFSLTGSVSFVKRTAKATGVCRL